MKLKATPANPNNNLEISLSHPSDDLTAPDFVELLVKPLMLGLGYHPDCVKDALGQYDEPSDQDAPEPPEGFVLLGRDVDDGRAPHPPGDVKFRPAEGTLWLNTLYLNGGSYWYAARIGSDAAKAFGKGGDE